MSRLYHTLWHIVLKLCDVVCKSDGHSLRLSMLADEGESNSQTQSRRSTDFDFAPAVFEVSSF